MLGIDDDDRNIEITSLNKKKKKIILMLTETKIEEGKHNRKYNYVITTMPKRKTENVSYAS